MIPQLSNGSLQSRITFAIFTTPANLNTQDTRIKDKQVDNPKEVMPFFRPVIVSLDDPVSQTGIFDLSQGSAHGWGAHLGPPVIFILFGPGKKGIETWYITPAI